MNQITQVLGKSSIRRCRGIISRWQCWLKVTINFKGTFRVDAVTARIKQIIFLIRSNWCSFFFFNKKILKNVGKVLGDVSW